MRSGVYSIKNIITDDLYIGSTNNMKTRFINHRYKLNKKIHTSPKLQNAWNKYGKENFLFEIAVLCSVEYTLILEKLLIDLYKPKYNICTTTTASRRGLKNSPEHIRKIIETKRKNGTYEKIAEKLKGNKYALGVKLSPERLSKLRKDRIEKGNKRVLQCDNNGNVIQEWLTGAHAGRSFGVTHKAIHNALKRGSRSCGYFWKYKY